MKRLTDNEIRFVKETGFTPTVWQCDEYYRTIWTDEHIKSENFFSNEKEARRVKEYKAKYSKLARLVAKTEYDFDLDVFLAKNLGMHDSDSISLEDVAVYLLYTFFTEEELSNMTNEEAAMWLKDYRYFYGFRKWEYCIPYVQIAIAAHQGKVEFYEDENENICYRSVENLDTDA